MTKSSRRQESFILFASGRSFLSRLFRSWLFTCFLALAEDHDLENLEAGQQIRRLVREAAHNPLVPAHLLQHGEA